jgi:hypothetical protein
LRGLADGSKSKLAQLHIQRLNQTQKRRGLSFTKLGRIDTSYNDHFAERSIAQTVKD